MKAYLSGKSIRVQTENPYDDSQLAQFAYELPRMPGLMPDGSQAFEMTRREAYEFAFGPHVEANCQLNPSIRSTVEAIKTFAWNEPQKYAMATLG